MHRRFTWHAVPKYRGLKWHALTKYRGLKWHALAKDEGLRWHALPKYRGLRGWSAAWGEELLTELLLLSRLLGLGALPVLLPGAAGETASLTLKERMRRFGEVPYYVP